MIPIYKPYLKKYKQSAIKCIEDEWISNHGIYVKLAADKLAAIIGVKYCILMNNGTAATHCLYKALKFKYPTISKIYIPNNVFVAPINCGLMEYDASVFEIMRINQSTLNIDTSEDYIRSLESNACVVVVHNLGNIVNVPRLQRLRPDLVFLEDNCEGLFGKYENNMSGSTALCSSVSFYGNKSITTGEGGAFLTNDPDVYRYINNIYSHGMSDQRYIHNQLGYNFRMTNIEAAFLYDQLNDYQHILQLKQELFDHYNDLLLSLVSRKIICKPTTEYNTLCANWMYVCLMTNLNYPELETFMEQKNIQIRPLFYDLHCHQHLKCLKKIDTNNITHGFMLPSYPELTFDQQKYIVSCLEEYVNLYI